MAQLTSSTASVVATNGIVWDNRPVNAFKVIQAYKVNDFILNPGDSTSYPAIVFVVDYGFQNNNANPPTADNRLGWAYASGDSATRDADFLIVDAAIGACSGGGGGVFKPAPALTGASKTSEDYTFNAVASEITSNDPDFLKFLYIVNTETNEVIYNINDPALGGTVDNRKVVVDFNTSAMDDSDVLIAVYDASAIDQKQTEDWLNLIYDELKIQTKLLKKILK